VNKRFLILRLILALTTPAMADETKQSVDDGAGAVQTEDRGLAPGTITKHIPCAGTPGKPVLVVYDITHGIQRAHMEIDGKPYGKPWPISGGRDRYETYTKNGHTYHSCSFTSVGDIVPTALIVNKTSDTYNDAPMHDYVELDAARGIGGHVGNTAVYSHGCIHQNPVDAQNLFNFVKSHSNMNGNQIACSDVSFKIIDNSVITYEGKKMPVAQARAQCYARLGQPEPIRVLADQTVPNLPQPRPAVSAWHFVSPPADHFSQVQYDPSTYQQQYKYMNEGFGSNGKPEFPQN